MDGWTDGRPDGWVYIERVDGIKTGLMLCVDRWIGSAWLMLKST